MKGLRLVGIGAAAATGLAIAAAALVHGPDRPRLRDDATFASIDASRAAPLVVTSLRTGGLEEHAGLQVGDAIVALDGERGPTLERLRHRLGSRVPVDLRVRRGGDEWAVHLLPTAAGEQRGEQNPAGRRR